MRSRVFPMSTHEQTELANFLAQGKPGAIANFIAGAPRMKQDLTDFYGPELDLDMLVDNLRSRDRERVEGTRELLDEFLQKKAGRLSLATLPQSVRQKAARLEMRDNLKLFGHSVVLSTQNLMQGKPIKGLQHAAKALTEATAAGLSGLSLTVRERKLAMALGVEMLAATTFTGHAQAAISQDDINAAINDFDKAPIEITISGGGLSHNFHEAQAVKSDYLLSPYLVKELEANPKAKQYVAWMFEAASQNGLDPVLFANQLFRETKHFSPNIIYGPDTSPAGAKGFGQFMESTGHTYGLNSDADFFNPKKAIFAAAHLMSDMTHDYNGDQILAMVAYNGGPDAVEYVKNALNKNDISGQDWLDFMNDRFEKIGATKHSAWHVETRGYIADITGQDWDKDYRHWAIKLQGNDAMDYLQTFNAKSAPQSAALDAIDTATQEAPTPMPYSARPLPPSQG